MFKDAKTLERQRTAANFKKAHARYIEAAETWFDGSVNSVDHRMGHCERLLHSANSTVARMSVADSQPYLRVAEDLRADHQVLADLRDDMLTGAASRQAAGPPGYKPKKPVPYGKGPGQSAGSNEFEHPAPRTKTPRYNDPNYEPHLGRTAALHEAAHWFDETSPEGQSWVKNLGPGQPHPRDYSSPQEYQQAYSLGNQLSDLNSHAPAGIGDYHAPSLDHDMTGGQGGAPGKMYPNAITQFHPPPSRLASIDQRWVKLESARFIAANTDCLGDSHELATRADHHAALQTSTFSPSRSEIVREAFVAEVVDLGAKTYRPPVRQAAVYQDFDAQAMYLC